ncbi:MAG: hypothetical protein R3Y43_00640 [Alphaproteobacteria bacterium]
MSVEKLKAKKRIIESLRRIDLMDVKVAEEVYDVIEKKPVALERVFAKVSDKPFMFKEYFDKVVDRFKDDGLSAEKYFNAAKKHPALFCQSSETIEKNILGVVERFSEEGFTTKDYLKAALKQPQLFSLTPETVEKNIREVVSIFGDNGLTTKDYLKSAVKMPQLFCQSSKTIKKNVNSVVDEFKTDGVTIDFYINLAVKNPPLFFQKPQTIIEHMKIIKKIAGDGMVKDPDKMLEALNRRPTNLSLSSDNLRLRYALGYGLKNNNKKLFKFSSLFIKSRPVIENMVVDEFGEDSKEVLKMRQMGMLKSKLK